MTISDVKDNLSAELHGSTLNKVRNIEMLLERAANNLLSHIDPIDTMRDAALSQLIHDDVYNYSLPSDYKDIIDLYPQDNRNAHDDSTRIFAGIFDLQKALRQKKVSIEGSEGSKIMRVNWRSRGGKTLHNMNSVTANGIWAAVGTASGIAANTIFKKSGSASIEFDLAASGDGISNTGMSAIDLTDEDEVADVFVWVYFGTITNLTSISARWGNDITANYWASTAQTTQADGTAFKAGWNLIKFSWSAATETGSVDPSVVDSFRLTVASTGAIANVRVDNIIFSIGRNFDIKYYSKFLLKNSAGTWITRTTSEDDTVVLDNDAINLYHMEILKTAAHQLEGSDSAFDLKFTEGELIKLYQDYNARYPSMAKKAVSSYGSSPGRGRW